MAWKILTEEDVLTVLSGPELDAYRSKALATGQTDPVEPTLSQITQLVRGHVAACGRNRLGVGESVPSELVAPALDLVAVRLPQRVGITPTAGRRELSMAAIAILERVVTCELQITPPDEPDTTVSTGPLPTICSSTPAYSRNQEDGV